MINMVKRCQYCGKEFEARTGNKKLCDNCKGFKVSDKPKAKKPISVTEMAAIIEKHNRKYGTSYTYGEFCKLVNEKKITVRNGGSFEK